MLSVLADLARRLKEAGRRLVGFLIDDQPRW
jgi:hypothetical protein